MNTNQKLAEIDGVTICSGMEECDAREDSMSSICPVCKKPIYIPNYLSDLNELVRLARERFPSKDIVLVYDRHKNTWGATIGRVSAPDNDKPTDALAQAILEAAG